MTIGRNRARMMMIGLLVVTAPAYCKPLVVQEDLEQAGFRLHWEASLPLASGDTLVAGYLRDEALYVVSDFGRLFAVTTDSGLIRWAAEVTAPDYTIYPPTHVVTVDATGPVVVPTATETFVYDRYSGRQLRRFQPDYTNAGPVVAVDDVILSGSTASRFYATRVEFQQNIAPLKLWEVATDGTVTAQPLLFDRDHVLFASRGGTVFACRAIDKQLRFRSRVGGSIIGDPAIDASGAYVSSTDRSLYKIDLNDGAILWRARFEAPLETGPVLVAHAVLQASDREGLTAIDPDTGKARWSIPDACKFASHSKAGDVLISNHDELLVIDHETGEVYSRVPTTDVVDVTPNTSSDAVFLLGRHGTIDALRIGDIPFLQRQKIIAARRTLNQRPIQIDAASEQTAKPKAERDPRADDPLRSKRDIDE